MIVIAIAAAVVSRLSTRRPHGVLIVAPMVAVIAMQFVTFQRSYHGEYVSRVATWLQGNIRGAIVQLMAESERRPAAPLYFTTLRSGLGHADLRNRWLPDYWRFYTVKHQRPDLIDRAVFLGNDDDINSAPPGSLILGNHEDPQLGRLLAAGATRLADIPEVNGPPFLIVVLR